MFVGNGLLVTAGVTTWELVTMMVVVDVALALEDNTDDTDGDVEEAANADDDIIGIVDSAVVKSGGAAALEVVPPEPTRTNDEATLLVTLSCWLR